MYFAILLIFMLVATGIAFDELKMSHPKEYESLGGENTLISPFAQMGLAGYFLAFQYRSIWGSISSKKLAFVAASIFTWAFIGYALWLLVQQLNT